MPDQLRAPLAGGWSDQSPVWIEMMDIIRKAKG